MKIILLIQELLEVLGKEGNVEVYFKIPDHSSWGDVPPVNSLLVEEVVILESEGY